MKKPKWEWALHDPQHDGAGRRIEKAGVRMTPETANALEAERDALTAEVEAARQSGARPLYWYIEARKLAAEVERVKSEYEYVITREPAAKFEAALRGILEHEPHEVVKDRFAYDRMVRAYRDAARAALADGATIEGV